MVNCIYGVGSKINKKQKHPRNHFPGCPCQYRGRYIKKGTNISQTVSIVIIFVFTWWEKMSRNVSGFAVLFDFGAEPGKSCGIYSQANVVHTYGHVVYESLLDHDVMTEFIETRKRPHKEISEYLKEVPEYMVSLVISCGWERSDKMMRNVSRVHCSPDCVKLSKRLCESLYDWGKSYVFNHVVSDPVVIPDTKKTIILKPFALNGENAHEYLTRLDTLGKDIGRTIGEWTREYGIAIRKR